MPLVHMPVSGFCTKWIVICAHWILPRIGRLYPRLYGRKPCYRRSKKQQQEIDAMRKIDVHEVIDNARFNRFHWMVLFWCALIIIFDGYDLVIYLSLIHI